MTENIDKTIEVLCDRIQNEVKTSLCIDENITNMVKALAELISARTKMKAIISFQ